MRVNFLIALGVSILLSACGSQQEKTANDSETLAEKPDWRPERWEEIPENPLIDPEGSGLPELVIGDPQIITPGEFDDQWHAFYHGFSHDEKGWHTWFFRSVSKDGLNWKEVFREEGEVGIQYMFADGDRWIQYYTATTKAIGDTALSKKYHTIVRARTTTDFENWSEPIDLIYPESELEREGSGIEARNPCVIRLPDGRYRMYYSAGMVFLDDAGYGEPKYIFVAESDNPLGPFVKREQPVLAPDPSIPYRNHGCGGFKAFGYGDQYVAFYNPIYIDSENKSRSEIRMLVSKDGLEWEDAFDEPIVKPEASIPWRSAIIYQLDVVPWKDHLWMFFNAREGWRGGAERIGAVRLALDGEKPLRKLQNRADAKR